jgi:hypothetical protein
VRPFRDGSDRYPDRERPPPPPPEIEDNEEYFLVESFVNSRGTASRLQYLVKWIGYPSHENTWRPATALRQDLSADLFSQLVADFEGRQAPIPAKTSKKTKVQRSKT